MNVWGELGIDLNRVCTFQAVAEDAEKADAKRCMKLTGGAVTSPGTQTARLLAWLASKGYVLADTQRATIEEALLAIETAPPGLLDNVVEVLQTRLRMARASTRKLQRMLDMSSPIDRALRGQFQFCGAGRTGRWSGRARTSCGARTAAVPSGKRPEGAAGPLVRSLESMENYYAGFGETWERLALIKARGIAGSKELAYEFLREHQPFIYPKNSLGYADV
jgi:glutamate-ammonia-ligase adenylyltransferase